MKELLPDNIIAMTQAPSQQKPKQREIRSILTSLPAFITYTAILVDQVPYRTRELLAYMRLIIREARRSSDNGWLNYDRIFRQNAAANPLLSWANLDPSLHASFCSKSSRSTCSLCNKPDHWADECARAPQGMPILEFGPVYDTRILHIPPCMCHLQRTPPCSGLPADTSGLYVQETSQKVQE